ncbi:MAG: DUF1460 domain-containing protein [Hyphomicrobiales bacterium]|nr:DUF1460 domain-containing protein [Hyphomicrobiales bacterium]
MQPEPPISRRHLLRLLAGGAALAVAGPPAEAAQARMTRLIEKAQSLPTTGERIDLISRALIGAPYRSHTLIGGPRRAEKFVTRDDVFDCVTYCEAVLAAALVRTPADYDSLLRQIRYRDGVVAWRQRNHYFTQWCDNNIANNICTRVGMPGGFSIDKKLYWMPSLGAPRMAVAGIPRASLLANKSMLATGDVIAFMSPRPRLDYFHTGLIVIAPNGEPRLRHAAQSRGRVLDEPLARFLSVNHVKAATVLRPRQWHDAAAQLGLPCFT